MTSQKVAFVSVNYNSSKQYADFLFSIAKMNTNRFQVTVIVVDNSSNSDDFKFLCEIINSFSDILEIILIVSSDNLGYSGGLNLGLTCITASKFDYIIMSNNDLVFSDDFLDQLFTNEYQRDVYVIYPDVITDGIKHENPRFITKISLLRRLMYRFYYSHYMFAFMIDYLMCAMKLGNRNKARAKVLESCPIYLGVGACFILTRDYFKTYVALDDSVFLWGEELLLSYQVRSAGGIQLYEPNLVVKHKAHVSVSSITGLRKYRMMKDSYNVYKSKF